MYILDYVFALHVGIIIWWIGYPSLSEEILAFGNCLKRVSVI